VYHFNGSSWPTLNESTVFGEYEPIPGEDITLFAKD
jgi:hypothetical protein